jgi:hypothetical protein
MGETKHFSIPASAALKVNEIQYMDYQKDREAIDSLLGITTKKLLPRLAIKVWLLPRMIKMMRMENHVPENERQALKQIKELNKRKTILQMAKLNEVWFKSEKVPASMQYLSLYRKRNKIMIEQILKVMNDHNANKVFVMVGAGHVPYFLWEMHLQSPQTKITLLNVDKF